MEKYSIEEIERTSEEVLGYLNFASGPADPKVFANLNRLFEALEASAGEAAEPTWRRLHGRLRERLGRLEVESAVFRESEQAAALLRIVFEELLPAYSQWHSDLLVHQSEEALFRPFFLGRALEAALSQGGPWTDAPRIVQGALHDLNEYIGYRPVAVLETEQKIQPYAHEWVGPIPLYLRGAGASVGPYQELIDGALAVLERTSPAILFQAFFELERLDELSMDPRAYDFDHPVNKRPNYLYGQWDLDHLDTAGYARRFVVHQVSLEAILDRVHKEPQLRREELMLEAAAVLACTMLMGSGVSANRPGSHDSNATLATLVQPIAVYRDEFYEQLLRQFKGEHGRRLRREAKQLRQPFGGARQHFNQYITLRRAEQLQNIHLALLYARIGGTAVAEEQVRKVPVASARMSCDIECRMVKADRHLTGGGLEAALESVGEAEELMHRAIHCGAMVDPWNILGFGGQFSLFPAMENSVHDFRIDELMETVGGLFDLLVQIRKESAAAGNESAQRHAAERLDALAAWWDKFATVEVVGDEGISGRETCESAEHVAQALRAWHAAGTASGDLAFWRDRVEQFRSPKAYALVIDALLELGDPVAAMALLVQWLSRVDAIPLTEEGYAFYELSLRWMEQLWRPRASEEGKAAPTPPADRWRLACKFLDYIEANAEEYWDCPEFELADAASADAGVPDADSAGDEPPAGDDEEDEYDDGGLYSAAYEGVTFRDSADDGIDSSLFDTGQSGSDEELVHEAERLVRRLSFLSMLAQLWKQAALGPETDDTADRDEELARWLGRAEQNRESLLRLLHTVHHHQLPAPRSTADSLAEFERRLALKEMLIEQISGTCLETADAARLLRVAMHAPPPYEPDADWERPMETVLRAVVRDDRRGVRDAWKELLRKLRKHPLLFVAVARGGDPARIVASRGIQWMLLRLLAYLPRLGLLTESAQLLQTAQKMELDHPVGPGAITEFDHLFQAGLRGVVRALVGSAEQWNTKRDEIADARVVNLLERLVEALMRLWFTHSRGLRLSPVESLQDEKRWREIKKFILDYGDELFTQRFLMNAGNLRAILHEGVPAYLDALADDLDGASDLRLIRDLGHRIDRKAAARSLELILEVVLEHYPEYVDYNNTTTQSDRGEMLFTLLDLLRVLGSYQRVAMNLQPVVAVHDELVRGGRLAAAEAWQEAVAQQSADLADEHIRRFEQLSREYGMRLRSIADRLAERFVQPLAVDRLRALVRPAVQEQREGTGEAALQQLREQAAPFAENLCGAGFEVPGWLEALEDEVDRVRDEADADADLPDPVLTVARHRLAWNDAVRQIDRIAREMA